MRHSPLRIIEMALHSSLHPNQPIRTVLIGPDLWLGFLLQLDLPQKSSELKKLTYIDGNEVIKYHMEIVRKSANYYEEYPFFFKQNNYIEGVRVLLYPIIR